MSACETCAGQANKARKVAAGLQPFAKGVTMPELRGMRFGGGKASTSSASSYVPPGMGISWRTFIPGSWLTRTDCPSGCEVVPSTTCSTHLRGMSYTGATDWTGQCESVDMGCTTLPAGAVDCRDLMSDIREVESY